MTETRKLAAILARPRVDMRRPFHIAFIVFALSYPANAQQPTTAVQSGWSV